jgi:L-ribulose-5-phosphate 3-epimerase
MNSFSRRYLLGSSFALGTLKLASGSVPQTGPKPLRPRLGMFVYLDGKGPDEALTPVKQLGLTCCEIYLNTFRDAYAAKLRATLERLGLEATALFASGPGAQVYDFYQGPETIGLVPRPFRKARVAAFKQASDFARSYLESLFQEIG